MQLTCAQEGTVLRLRYRFNETWAGHRGKSFKYIRKERKVGNTNTSQQLHRAELTMSRVCLQLPYKVKTLTV